MRFAPVDFAAGAVLDITGLAIGDHGERRQVAIMIQEKVQLDTLFISTGLTYRIDQILKTCFGQE